jgi:hypothetical protein
MYVSKNVCVTRETEVQDQLVHNSLQDIENLMLFFLHDLKFPRR